MRRLIAVTATALAALSVAACGGSSSQGTSASTAPTPSSSASSSSSTASAALSAAQGNRLDIILAQFNRQVKTGDRLRTAMAATSMAATLSGLAVAEVGTSLSAELTAASNGWTKLSDTILHGDDAAVAQAELKVRELDGAIPRRG